MDSNEYIRDRLEDQIEWYSKKSGENQVKYKSLRVLSIIFAVSIPFLTGLINDNNDDELKIIIGVLGVLIAIMEGVMGLNKYQENWVKYRHTCETLRSMSHLYSTRTTPFDGPDRFNLLVELAEGVMSEEHSDWVKTQLQKKDYEGERKGRKKRRNKNPYSRGRRR